jgi:hemerythrin-like metal-binding protein
MSIANWSDDFCTGDALVDKHHRALFDIVNELEAAMSSGNGRAALGSTLRKLWTLGALHFAVEEQLMDSQRYPDLLPHRAQHEQSAAQMKSVMDHYLSGGNLLPTDVACELGKWFAAHICDHDRRMIRWMRQNARGVVATEIFDARCSPDRDRSRRDRR